MCRFMQGVRFARKLIRKASEDEILELANGLAYRVLLAFFPFLIFLMSLLGYLNLDDSVTLDRLYGVLPPDIGRLISRFLTEMYQARNKGLLSTSLFFTLYNSANGFRAAMRCVNKAYGFRDNRGLVTKVGVGLLLMLTFSLSIVVMLLLLIFGGQLFQLARPYLPENTEPLYTLLSALVSMVVLVLATMLIYKLACAQRLKMMDVFPGASVTVLLWVVSSKAFSFFMTNYSNYSVLYGSIAGVFVLILWLNLVSLILLIGNEINSMLVIEK